MFERFTRNTVNANQAQYWPRYVVLFCFLMTFIRFPGEWDNDTVSQHAQMLAGQYFDWHPPVFAAFWGLLNSIWNGLTGMGYTGSAIIYLAHSTMLWGGLFLLVVAAKPFFASFIGKEHWKFLALLAGMAFFGLFEMVPMTRFIFKDTAMMAAYILSLGVMLNMPAHKFRRLLAALFCIILLFYGTGVRHNSIFALIPMLWLLVIKTGPGLRVRWLIPSVVMLWAGILLGVNGVNYGILKAKKEYSLQEIVYVDFWRLNYKTKSFDLPPLPEGQSWAPLERDIFFRFYNDKSVYINSSFKYIREYYGGEDSIRLRYDFGRDPGAFGRLTTAWVDKVKNNLGVYLDIHKKIFMELLRSFSFMGLNGAWYLAAGLLIVLLGAARLFRGRSGDPTPYLVTLSGLFYIMPYLAAVPAIERRYLFWFYFSGFFGICWLAAQIYLKRRALRTG